jgi:hypothetical protein
MFKAILAALVLGALALGIWVSSDLWTAASETTTETIGEQERAVFHVTGMT